MNLLDYGLSQEFFFFFFCFRGYSISLSSSVTRTKFASVAFCQSTRCVEINITIIFPYLTIPSEFI